MLVLRFDKVSNILMSSVDKCNFLVFYVGSTLHLTSSIHSSTSLTRSDVLYNTSQLLKIN